MDELFNWDDTDCTCCVLQVVVRTQAVRKQGSVLQTRIYVLRNEATLFVSIGR